MTKPNIAILIETANGLPTYTKCYTMELTVVLIEDGKPRNPSYSYGGKEYSDFRFRASLSWYNDTFRSSSWEVCYRDPYCVRYSDAERMFKHLRKCFSVKDKMPVSPKSFGQYVSLMAQGLGIKTVIERTSGDSSSYDNNEYRTSSIQYIERMIDREIDRIKSEVRPDLNAQSVDQYEY